MVVIQPGARCHLDDLPEKKRNICRFAIPKWRSEKDRGLARAAFRAMGPSVVKDMVYLRHNGHLTTWEPIITPDLAYYQLFGDVVNMEDLLL